MAPLPSLESAPSCPALPGSITLGPVVISGKETVAGGGGGGLLEAGICDDWLGVVISDGWPGVGVLGEDMTPVQAVPTRVRINTYKLRNQYFLRMGNFSRRQIKQEVYQHNNDLVIRLVPKENRWDDF